jgi:thioredoxin
VPPPAAPPPAAKAAASGADAPFNRAGSGRRRAGGKAVAGKVTAINSKKDFDALLASTRSKQLVVVDFFATWCGPCQQIAPKYEAMAAALPQAKFVKVDVDQAKDLSQQYGVQSMPTFKLFRGGQVVDEMKGADENALKEKIEALAGKADRWAAVGAGKKL